MLRRTFLIGAGATSAMAACSAAPSSEAAVSEADSRLAEAKYPALGKIYDVAGQKVHSTDQGSGRPVRKDQEHHSRGAGQGQRHP